MFPQMNPKKPTQGNTATKLPKVKDKNLCREKITLPRMQEDLSTIRGFLYRSIIDQRCWEEKFKILQDIPPRALSRNERGPFLDERCAQVGGGRLREAGWPRLH